MQLPKPKKDRTSPLVLAFHQRDILSFIFLLSLLFGVLQQKNKPRIYKMQSLQVYPQRHIAQGKSTAIV